MGPAGSVEASVVICDGQKMLAECLSEALKEFDGIRPLAFEAAGASRVMALVKSKQPQVVVVDQFMYRLQPLKLLGTISELGLATKVIFTSSVHSADHIRTLISSGAAGYLPKSITVNELAEAIAQAARGELPVFASRLNKMLALLDKRSAQTTQVAAVLERLSARELEVLKLLSIGRLPEQVALEMGIKRGTVKTHIHSILKKTGTRSQGEALALARYAGLFTS